MNDSSSFVNYTLSGLLPFTTFDIRVTADSSATDTIPENMIDERSQVVTITTEQGSECSWCCDGVVVLLVVVWSVELLLLLALCPPHN